MKNGSEEVFKHYVTHRKSRVRQLALELQNGLGINLPKRVIKPRRACLTLIIQVFVFKTLTEENHPDRSPRSCNRVEKP